MTVLLRNDLLIWALPATLLLAAGLYAGWRTHVRARGLFHPLLLKSGRDRDHLHRLILLGMATTLLLVALLGPTWGVQSREETSVVRDVYLAVDVSRSMRATDVAPDRLTRVRQTVAALTDRFPDFRYNLILFAAAAWLRVPLTSDRKFINQVLEETDPETFHPQGTDLKLPLQMVADEVSKSGHEGGTVGLITDGEHNGPGSPFEVVPELNRYQVKIIAIGVGNPEGAPVPLPGGGYAHDASNNIVFSRPSFTTLDELARATDGIAVELNNSNPDWDPIGTALAMIETRRQKTIEHLQLIDRSPLFVFAALLLLLLAVAPAPVSRTGLSLVIIFLAGTGCSGGAGFAAFDQKEYRQAAQIFAADAADQGKPAALNNLGASIHELANYPTAVSAFLLAATRHTEAELRADSLYNAGNALFKAGDLERAMGAWEASLKIREDEDTRVNLEVAKRLLKERQQKSSQPKQVQQKQAEQKDPKDDQQNSGESATAVTATSAPTPQSRDPDKTAATGKKQSSILLQQRMENLQEGQPRSPGSNGGDSAHPW